MDWSWTWNYYIIIILIATFLLLLTLFYTCYLLRNALYEKQVAWSDFYKIPPSTLSTLSTPSTPRTIETDIDAIELDILNRM